MIKLKKPDEWNIKIWKEDKFWYMKYNEYILNTEENKEYITDTINGIKQLAKVNIFGNIIKLTEIKKDTLIGVEMIIKTSDFKRIADQLTTEFMYFSDFGDTTIKTLFEILLGIGMGMGVK